VLALAIFGSSGAAVVAVAGEVIRVPGDVTNLQTAIYQIDDGGTIAITAGQVLDAPAGGFQIEDLGKSFTIAAEVPGTVTIDGGGTGILVKHVNVNLVPGDAVTYDGLVFANGRASAVDTGAITVIRAEATFVDCRFHNNTDSGVSANTGAVHVSRGKAFFVDCTWTDNVATTAGGGLAVQASEAWVMRGLFDNNRTNPPNHTWSSRGGGIWVGDGNLKVANSRFEDNRAGYVGGGLYAIGTFEDPVSIPTTEVIVTNSSFVRNGCEPDPSVVLPVPSEGGGLHAENQATARIFSSRFYDNTSELGGGVNLYRALVEVENSVFIGNRAIHEGDQVGIGGAMSATSNDTNNATTGGGTINRRSASLTVRDTYIAGVPGATVAQTGGGIRVSGDNNRVYGTAGVTPMGTVAENRGQLVIDRSVFNDLDLWSDPKSSYGGGLAGNLCQLDLRNSLILDSHSASANGNGQAGGVMLLNQSAGVFDNVSIAGNSAQTYGGGITVNGSRATITDCALHHNAIQSSVVNQSYGAAMYSTPDINRDLNTSGLVETSIFTNNDGLPIYDDDRDLGPINGFVYNQNAIFNTTYGDSVYKNRLDSAKTVSGLNNLVINRSNLTTTVKSTIDNLEGDSEITSGQILTVPPLVIPQTAIGDDETSTPSFLAVAWSGDNATLNGQTLTDRTEVRTNPAPGTHVLRVDGNSSQATVTVVSLPWATFSASPVAISSGESAVLSWYTPASPFLEMDIDQGVQVAGNQATGSVTVSPTATTTYRLFVVTRYGGTVAEATVYVDEDPPNPPFFSDGFESGDTARWSYSIP
jgi:hypothetical protein